MFTKKSVFVTLFISLLVFALVLVSASIPMGSSAPQTVAASDNSPAFRAADVGNTTSIMVQAEPTLPDVATVEPAPTDIVVITEVAPTDVPAPTPDPNDPADNPAAPGGVLNNLLVSVVSYLTGTLVTFVGMLKVFTMLKENKSAENTIEQLVNTLQNLFLATPIKPTLGQLGQGLQDAGQVLKDVTDGKME